MRLSRSSIGLAAITVVAILASSTPAQADVSREDVDTALQEARELAAALGSAQERLDAASTEVLLLGTRISSAESEFDQIERRVALAELSVREQAIVAYMTSRDATPGLGGVDRAIETALKQAYSDTVIGDRVRAIRTLQFLQADRDRLAGHLEVLRSDQEAVLERIEDAAKEILTQLEAANAEYRLLKDEWDQQEVERRRREEEERKRREAAAAVAAAAAQTPVTVGPPTIPMNLGAEGRTCPVDGAASFRDTWGAPRPGSRTHKGTDMSAPLGTPLVAIESGTVVQMSNHYAGGLGLYLQGNETRTVYYYAHLRGFAGGIGAGVSVGKGQLLGWVGVTGNATAPNLHFGLMPQSLNLSNLQNPFPLLQELCQ